MSAQLDDLTGQTFGHLTVVRLAPKRASPSIRWIANCECGGSIDVQAGHLRSGAATTCSSSSCRFRRQRADERNGRKIGERFGSLVVESFAPSAKPGQIFASCRCDCGNTVSVRLRSLRAGQTKTCGCGVGSRDTYDVDGKRLTARQIAKSVGVNQHTLRRHLVAGRSVQEAVSLAKESRSSFEARVTFDLYGVSLTLGQLSELCGLTRKRVMSQVQRGLSAEEVAADKRRPNATAHQIAGQKFGRLLVIESAGTHPTRRCSTWRCVCDCGQERTVAGVDLKNGHTTSCGCAVNERIGALRRGFRKNGTTSAPRCS